MFPLKDFARLRSGELLKCAFRISRLQLNTIQKDVRCVATVSSLFQPVNLAVDVSNDAKAKKDEQQLAKSQKVTNGES